MGHLVEDGAALVVVVVDAARGELGEVPVTVVGAGDDDFGAGDRVQQGAAVAAAAVGVRAGDGGRRRLDVGHALVDTLHLRDHRGRLEPRGEVVGRGAGGGLGIAGQRDGVADARLQGRGLRGAAGAVLDGALLDA